MIKFDEKPKDESGRAELLRKQAIRVYLEALDHKLPIEVGKIAITIGGPLANIGLMVVSKGEDGTVMVAPAPGMAIIPMLESQLFCVEDFRKAFEEALRQHPYSMAEIFQDNPGDSPRANRKEVLH